MKNVIYNGYDLIDKVRDVVAQNKGKSAGVFTLEGRMSMFTPN